MSVPHLNLILPEHLQRFVPAARRGLAFGIPALDALLPFGLPRGQITALDAPLGSGGTALLLALAEATLRADEGVAFVDVARTLAPQGAAHLAGLGQFWVIRPRGAESAWWCADVLLRTGAFGLVAVDQAPAPSRTVAVRLQRLARDKDAVLVVREADGRTGAQGHGGTDAQAHRGTGAQTHRRTETTAGERPDRWSVEPDTHRAQPGASPGPHERKVAASPRNTVSATYGASVRLRVRASAAGFLPAVPGPGAAWPGPRGVKVTIEKGGAPGAAEVPVDASLPHRLRPHWVVRDRRGEPAGGRRSLSGRGQRPRAARPDWPVR